MKLKICGIKHLDNARQLLTLAPDYLGFIFYKKSPRHVGELVDLDWVKSLPGSARKVGVFVNEQAEVARRMAEALDLPVVQLHGDEPPEYCGWLKMQGLEVWKAFGVDEGFDFEKTADYATVCDRFLFDTKGGNRGGHGVPFDWSLLEKYRGRTPYILSGGIGPGDAAAIHALRAKNAGRISILDINSRFESVPGRKDYELVKTFHHELFS